MCPMPELTSFSVGQHQCCFRVFGAGMISQARQPASDKSGAPPAHGNRSADATCSLTAPSSALRSTILARNARPVPSQVPGIITRWLEDGRRIHHHKMCHPLQVAGHRNACLSRANSSGGEISCVGHGHKEIEHREAPSGFIVKLDPLSRKVLALTRQAGRKVETVV